jgi:hypothetical protein
MQCVLVIASLGFGVGEYWGLEPVVSSLNLINACSFCCSLVGDEAADVMVYTDARKLRLGR